MKKYVPAVLFLGLVIAATVFSGCDNGTTTTIPSGLNGAKCSVNSECLSNDCVYPGICK